MHRFVWIWLSFLKTIASSLINLRDKNNTVEDIQGLCYGKPHAVDWSGAGNVATMKKCLHFILEQLRGFSLDTMCCAWRKKDNQNRREVWRNGTSITLSRFAPGITIATSSFDGLPSGLHHRTPRSCAGPQHCLRNSLRNLSQVGVLAQVHEIWPLTLYDLDTRILKVLGPIFSSLTKKALGFHGTPGVGKTPAARCVAMVLSRHWIDFFRGAWEAIKIHLL